MLEKYISIESTCEAEIISKKSKFIATTIPIKNENDAEKNIEEIKRKYRDARHNVYAYRTFNNIEKCSDDGEPSGTAGVPLLDIIKGENLYNVLIVVTRYFGGILLGTGGLVRAYSDSAKEAIRNCKKTEKYLCTKYQIEIEYTYYNKIQHYCNSNGYIIEETDFSNGVKVNIIVRKTEEDKFIRDMTDLLNGDEKISVIERDFYV